MIVAILFTTARKNAPLIGLYGTVREQQATKQAYIPFDWVFILIIISGSALASQRGPTGRDKNAQNRTFRRAQLTNMFGEAAAHMEAGAARGAFQDQNTATRSTPKSVDGTMADSDASGDEDGHPRPTSAKIRARESSKRAALDVTGNNNGCKLWIYKDPDGCLHGPYSESRMAFWFALGCIHLSFPVKRLCDKEFRLLGQVIKSWGKLPFQPQNPPPRGGYDQRSPPPSMRSALPANPGARAAPVFGKSSKPSAGKLALIPDSQIRQQQQQQTVRIRVLPIASEQTSPVKPNPEQPKPSAGFDKALLGVPYSAPFPEDNREKDVKMQASTSDGAWGGFQKGSQTARSVVPKPPLNENPAGNCQPQTASERPLTWAQVCEQGGPAEPERNERAKQERVAIENMARFPSLGGKAFASSAQKNRPQRNPEERNAAYEEFVRWSYAKLTSFPSYVHVPTFFELLRDVNSEEEIEEYARLHLGRGEEVRRFVQEFLQRKSQCKKLAGWTRPVPRAANLGAKGRKKMQKVDSSMLGFVMTKKAPKKV